jgi:hypothetical protein
MLQAFNHKSFALAAMAGLALLSVQSRSAYAAGPFSRFAGSWFGGGTISMADGSHERIRCRVSYSVADAGTALNQDLVCASESYKFDVRSDVTEQGGAINGNWSETTRGVTGNVSGSVRPGVILATVAGTGFTAGLSLAVRGNTQYVQIRPQGSTDVRGVSVTLKRQ